MNEYTPDYWILLKVSPNNNKEPFYRILASWSGGYLYGDSWKLSSGVETFESSPDGEQFISEQTSGSVYILNRRRECISVLISSVLQTYVKQMVGYGTIEQVSADLYVKVLE